MSNLCGSCGKGTTRQAGPSGFAVCAKCLPVSKLNAKMKRNPQLQILENPGMLARFFSVLTGPSDIQISSPSDFGRGQRTPEIENGKPKNPDFNEEEFQKALAKYKEFHEVKDHRFETEMWIDDGSDDVVHVVFAGLGKIPFISWKAQGSARGIKRHTFDVEDEVVDFVGQRISFSGRDMPWLVCDSKTNEAIIIGGGVEKIKQYADANGFIGYVPAIEYIVEWKSSKKGSHYVHCFNSNNLPKLVWDKKLNGLRYVGGIYCIRNWFYD